MKAGAIMGMLLSIVAVWGCLIFGRPETIDTGEFLGFCILFASFCICFSVAEK